MRWLQRVACYTRGSKAALLKRLLGRGQDVEEKLEAELGAGLDACVEQVAGLVAPLGEATAAAVARLRDAEARVAALGEDLEGLKQRAAAVE